MYRGEDKRKNVFVGKGEEKKSLEEELCLSGNVCGNGIGWSWLDSSGFEKRKATGCCKN